MKVLVDSSVWIEYFRSRPQMAEENLGFLDLLIADDRVCTIWPIAAELLSGKLSEEELDRIRQAFTVMDHIDSDWNSPDVWGRIADFAGVSHQRSLPLPGIVDRMILNAVKNANASLWTLDRPMKRLAEEIGVRLF